MIKNVPLTYIAGVSGNEYKLKTDGIRSKTANYHIWQFDPDATELRFGVRLHAWKKAAQVYETTLYFEGSYEEKRATCDNLHNDFELDILEKVPGRIIWGDYYIECYMHGSSTYPGEHNIYTVNDVNIYCPYPFWIRERKKSFYAQDEPTGEQPFLDYTFDFRYDFTYEDAGYSNWDTEHPFSSDFQLTIFGPAVNPTVLINDHIYRLDYTLESGEYVVVDSRANTITLHRANGTKRNLYNFRYLEQSIFEKIPGGVLTIYWSGAFGFDLLLYQERSEPTWNG